MLNSQLEGGRQLFFFHSFAEINGPRAIEAGVFKPLLSNLSDLP